MKVHPGPFNLFLLNFIQGIQLANPCSLMLNNEGATDLSFLENQKTKNLIYYLSWK